MSARPITAQRVHDAIRVCAPISVRTIIRHLAKHDDHAAREVRRGVASLLEQGAAALGPGPSQGDRRVLIAGRAPAKPVPPPVALPRRPARVGRWYPPMPRERPVHLVPAPALQPQWPAIRSGAPLAPRITGGFIHG